MEKNIFNINNNELSYGRGYVYSLQYHLVWCTKYRKKILKDGIDAECKEMLYDLAEEYKFQILAMEVMPDHIHLLVDCRPQFYIPDMIKIMKGNIARQMFLAHPELKRELWGGHLWNPSYCAVAVSDRSREQVCSYIEGQLSSMLWEVCPHIRRGWNCGKKRIKKVAGRSWCVIIMLCRYSTEM